MEINNMNEGDVAGLSVFQNTFSFIAIKVLSGEKRLVAFINSEMHTGPVVNETAVFLRVVANYNTGKASFFYSIDNTSYNNLGVEINLEDSPSNPFSGNRFGIFNYSTFETGGYVDIDWFSTENVFSEDTFYPLNFDGYTEESLTLTDIFVEEGEKITVLTKSSKRLKLKALFADGHIEDISTVAGYANQNPGVVAIYKGMIRSFSDGESDITIDYTGPLGHQKQISVKVVSTTFPLTNELFNPKIWENGIFNEDTKTLHTGQYGFGGWLYDGIDLSGYKYIVVRLGSDNNADIDFRLFDGTSYWGSPATFKFGNSREVVVILEYAKKNDGKFLNPDHIYIAGFWSNGSASFVIDTLFLSNSSEYDPPVILVNNEGGVETFNLNGFSYIEGNGPSSVQSFTVSGYLLAGNISVKAPTGFEVSLDSTQGYAANLTLYQSQGQADVTKVYVRMKSGLTGKTYSGNISVSSTGAFTRTILLSGIVEKFLGIEDIYESGAIVILTEYYTLSGQKIYNIDNHKGFIIVRKIFSDGKISTKKIYKEK
jgi:endoglucanase